MKGMIIEQAIEQFALIKDVDNSNLKGMLKNNTRLKEIHIDTYPENPLITSSKPFVLLLRAVEKNVIITYDEKRIILKKNNQDETCFMNVPYSEITECYCKVLDNYYEFILNIQNTYYKITIFN